MIKYFLHQIYFVHFITISKQIFRIEVEENLILKLHLIKLYLESRATDFH